MLNILHMGVFPACECVRYKYSLCESHIHPSGVMTLRQERQLRGRNFKDEALSMMADLIKVTGYGC